MTLLMQLFVRSSSRKPQTDKNGVRLRVIGDLSCFDPELRSLISASQRRLAMNDKLTLTIAANYGGRWDIVQAVNRLVAERGETGELDGR